MKLYDFGTNETSDEFAATMTRGALGDLGDDANSRKDEEWGFTIDEGCAILSAYQTRKAGIRLSSIAR